MALEGIQKITRGAFDEVQAEGSDAVDAPRGQQTANLLAHVAASGASNVAWAGGLREVLVVEVRKAATILLRTLAAQLSKNDKGGMKNQTRHENDALLKEMAADTEYMVDELRAHPSAPSTSQRICEVLLSPLQYHTTTPKENFQGIALAHEGQEADWNNQVEILRPRVLHDVLRKCILATPTGVC